MWGRSILSQIPYRQDGTIISKDQYLAMLKDTDVCPLCEDNSGWFYDTVTEQNLDCVCNTLQYEFKHYEPNLRKYASKYRKDKTIKGLSVDHLRPKAKKLMNGVITASTKWEQDAHTWVVLHGEPGCGKSHILEAMASSFYPVAMYLSADDFNTKIRLAVGTKTLDVLVAEVSRHPILLFDDWGTGFDTDFTQSTMRSIMQNRYNFHDQFPTMITTNMTYEAMFNADPRLCDRMFGTAKWVDMSEIPSYRRRKRI
jgi:DNA replication protein DnaC